MGAFVYIVLLVALASITYGLYKRLKIWRLGQPVQDLGPWKPRVKRFLPLVSKDILLHRRFLKKDLYPGIMHFCLFWGAAFLLIATSVAAIEENLLQWFDITFITRHYRVQASLIWDLGGGGLALIGVSMALYRRYIIKPPRLNTVLEDPIILAIIFSLVITGFMIEGLRLGATELNPASEFYDTSAALWSPLGLVFAQTFILAGMSVQFIEQNQGYDGTL